MSSILKSLSVKERLDIGFKVGGLLGLACIAWLTAHFPSRDEFNRLAADMSDLKTAVKLLAEQSKHNARQDDQIKDLDVRTRSNEGRINRLEAINGR